MSSPMASGPSDEVVHDFRLFRVYKDGRIELFRPTWDEIPPSNDPATGVRSKDVTISADPLVSARIFLPELKNPTQQKFPLLLHIHGGAFCSYSPFSPMYHNFCNTVAAEAEVIVVSVNYGLFPTRPIPACYDDSWTALQWVADHVSGNGPEPWLNKYANFLKLFIGGDSAGGNITHTLAVRIDLMGLPKGVKVEGIILVHPYFVGTKDDEMCLYMFPTNVGGLEDPRLNPPLEDLGRVGCERVMIFVAENDDLKNAGMNYYDKLKKSGWKGSVEMFENKGVGHVFHLSDPKHGKAVELKNKFVSFLKQ